MAVKTATMCATRLQKANAFSMTGKFLGNIDLRGTESAREMAQKLHQAGLARGLYLIRGSGATLRVQVR